MEKKAGKFSIMISGDWIQLVFNDVVKQLSEEDLRDLEYVVKSTIRIIECQQNKN
jgi:hypothetical protein